MKDPREPPRSPRQERFGRRLGRSLLTGSVIGIVAGLLVGAIAGALFADGLGPRVWATMIGCVIFGGTIGALVGGYAGLESPSPGREPSDTTRPIRDRPELTRDEAER
jgi:gas vesicle protein